MEKWKEWLEVSKGDLAAAESLGQAGFYAQACFYCQQSVEKVLKALLIKRRNAYPKIHSLSKLAAEAGVLGELSELVSDIETDYTMTRYVDPGVKLGKEVYSYSIFKQRISAARKTLAMVEKWIKD